MSTTGYIVWDSKNKRIVGGPFSTTGEATTFLNRAARRNDSRATDKSSKDQSSQFTTETVTIN